MKIRTWLIIIGLFLLFSFSVQSVNTDPYISRFARNSTNATNAIHNYSNNPQYWKLSPSANETWIISRMLVHISDNDVANTEDYGGLSALSNGLVVVTNISGNLTNLTEIPVTSNAVWGSYSYDVAYNAFGTGSADNDINIRWTFANGGTYIKLESGDFIGVYLQDDFTGLQEHYFQFQGYIEQTEVYDPMGSLSITFFVLVVTVFLFLLPFIKKEFSRNRLVDLIAKRCCWVVAIYLMVLNSAIMATIANEAGLPLTQEMFRYLWLFGWGGYLMMAFTVIKTLFDVKDLYKWDTGEKRMGEN